MAETSTIEWTDATWNIVTGCSVLSPGCANCYAMRLAGTRLKHHPSRKGLTRDTKAGPVWTGEVRFNEEWLDQPLRWRRPKMIFVAAHGDLFHDDVPDEWLDKIFAVMALAPQHTFQVLTKRAERMRAYFSAAIEGRSNFGDRPAIEMSRARAHVEMEANLLALKRKTALPWRDDGLPGKLYGFHADLPWPLPNVWIGVSVEDQVRADERIPDLLATPAAVRWLSCEPLLGPIDLTTLDGGCDGEVDALDGIRRAGGAFSSCKRIDWVVAGGESGPGARPMRPDWARSLRDQCAAAGVPYFFKQWGSWHADALAYTDTEGRCPPPRMRIGKKRAGRLLDGVEHNGVPA